MDRPEIIVRWNDSLTPAHGWLVIDRLINGVCGGGTFMHAAATEEEVADLARTMSYKNTLQRIPFGGAKAGLRYDHARSDAKEVLERFLCFLKPWLQTVWCTGADLNTSNQTMQAIINNMGLHSMFGPLGKMVARKQDIVDQSDKIFSRMVHRMTPYFNLSEGASGYSAALTIGLTRKCTSPRIFIQGFGLVGRSLAYFIQHLNLGKVVGISDVSGVLYVEDGIDIFELLNAFVSANKSGGSMDQWLGDALKEKFHYQSRRCLNDEGYIIDTLKGKNFDILSPCAARYTITTKVIDIITQANHSLQIISGANNAFDSEKTRETAIKKGVTCFPEWISNCGNAILYEELLSFSEMPRDYNTVVRESIQEGIRSFLGDAEIEKHEPKQWYEILTQTAMRRITLSKMHPELQTEKIAI